LCDRIRIASGVKGIERVEAHLRGEAFAPHRHDTYAIGIALSGVQTFRFRGERWHCLPGQCHILHPDETHDGAAATGEGFSYRIVYVDPLLVHAACGGGSLPFVARPVVEGARLPEGSASEIWDLDADLDDIARTGLVVAVDDLLNAATGRCAARLHVWWEGACPARRRPSVACSRLHRRHAGRAPLDG
jgi:hypothetical protein